MDHLYATSEHDQRDIDEMAHLMRAFGGPGDVKLFLNIDHQTDVRDLLPSVRSRPSSYIASKIARCRSSTDGIWRNTSPAPSSSSCRVPPTHGMPTTHFPRRWNGSSPRSIRRRSTSIGSSATVLFTDIVDSTKVAASMGDRAWAELVTEHHRIVRGQLARYRGVEMDTAGDGFYATFDGPARAVRCALAIEAEVRRLSIEVRAGVHTGEMQMIDGKMGGIAVALGARIASLAGPSEVLVSQTVRDLVAGSGLVFEAAGEHELKGVPDRWQVYRVVA